ncbi:MAG: hypothetical protein ACR2MD_03190 [Aridibacter sp.]
MTNKKKTVNIHADGGFATNEQMKAEPGNTVAVRVNHILTQIFENYRTGDTEKGQRKLKRLSEADKIKLLRICVILEQEVEESVDKA